MVIMMSWAPRSAIKILLIDAVIVILLILSVQKKEPLGDDDSIPEDAENLEGLTADILSVRQCFPSAVKNFNYDHLLSLGFP